GEHVDAFANEGFIGTATQWDSLRRMVEMLDYHPAPPASAATRMALFAKEELAGTVAQGYQIKHAPLEGGAPVVFETLEDIIIDHRLNELRLKVHLLLVESFAFTTHDNRAVFWANRSAIF
ncbi:MAG: hypothetical protein IIB17_00640, partial [Chloroflexi bacterium]|nr:hypothetical protein [Chloroflexota bacterium]